MKNQVQQNLTLAILAEGHNLPANWAEEGYKHSDAEVLFQFNSLAAGLRYIRTSISA